jgi:hypothetical protein
MAIYRQKSEFSKPNLLPVPSKNDVPVGIIIFQEG